MDKPDFRSIPGVDKLLATGPCRKLISRHGRDVVVFAVRDSVAKARAAVGTGKKAPEKEEILAGVTNLVLSIAEPSLRPVVNATGVALHTNLGRAPLGDAMMRDITKVARAYANVEFDLATGKRGHRASHVAGLIRYLTGCEDAVVVNNNAAAIILVLATFAKNKEVIISRGELIEIGGSFRIPDIMKAGGARMVEVGTTNRTRVGDYEGAISQKTGLLFKAHQSNYSITGFTEEASVGELATLAHWHGLPCVYDIGSGLVRKPENLPLRDEPDVQSSINVGADLVTFSCDKLLGGPQAGIIAGRADLIERLAKAPLMRALRVGKLTLAALSSALRHYLTDEALVAHNPTFAMLSQSEDALASRAEKLLAAFAAEGIDAEILESGAQVGGGTLPGLVVPSRAVALIAPKGPAKQKEKFAESLHRALLRLELPVLGVLREGRLMFDIATLSDDDVEIVVKSVREVVF